MRILSVFFTLFLTNQLYAQNWFQRNFEVDVIEFKVGHAAITNQTWKDNMYGASALDYLEDAKDNGGIKRGHHL